MYDDKEQNNCMSRNKDDKDRLKERGQTVPPTEVAGEKKSA